MKKNAKMYQRRMKNEGKAGHYLEKSFFFWLGRSCVVFMTIFYFKLYYVELLTALENMPVLHIPLIVAFVLLVTIIMWNYRGALLGLFYIAVGLLYITYSERIFLSVSVLALSYLLVLIGLMFLLDTFYYWINSRKSDDNSVKRRAPMYASEVDIKKLILKNNKDKNGKIL